MLSLMRDGQAQRSEELRKPSSARVPSANDKNVARWLARLSRLAVLLRPARWKRMAKLRQKRELVGLDVGLQRHLQRNVPRHV